MKTEIEDYADQSQLLSVGPSVKDGFIIDRKEAQNTFRFLIVGIVAASLLIWAMAAWFGHRDKTLEQKYGGDPASHVWFDDGGGN